ncbi:hypothetical protein FKB34_01875 [Glycocaulis profundi]|nr:hypothetical protein FKB34_01875 [Glycocaulis profundi]
MDDTPGEAVEECRRALETLLFHGADIAQTVLGRGGRPGTIVLALHDADDALLEALDEATRSAWRDALEEALSRLSPSDRKIAEADLAARKAEGND